MDDNSTSISVHLLFFAKARELSGLSEAIYQISSPKIIASVLLERICSTYNLNIIRDNLIIAVNENYCDNLGTELQLREGDEIAIIPPISDTCGAISLFVGTTRDSFEGRKVITLEYEAYESMALKQLKTVCEELRRQWPDILNIAIYHRLGLVPVRQSCVVIAISSPHRKTSLDAVASAIEGLKKHVPIWKKEKYEDNECSWKENKESNENDNEKSLQFDEKICNVDKTYELSNQLVQILVGEDEIVRRINCFVERKRNEIDLCNIMDYTERQKGYNGKEYDDNNGLETCARVNSSIIKQEFSKCHLKVKRVKNSVGPQMRRDYLNALDKLMTSSEKLNLPLRQMDNDKYCNSQSSKILDHSTIINRIENIEQHLDISPSSISDIYKRLKNIEDRILYLECISPEYQNFLQIKYDAENPHRSYEAVKNGTGKSCFSSFERKIYNANDIDSFIQCFEN